MKRGTVESVERASTLGIPEYLKIRELIDKLKNTKSISVHDLSSDEKELVLKFKDIFHVYGVSITDSGYFVVRSFFGEKIKKIRNFVLKHPFIKYYVPNDKLENLIKLLENNKYIEYVEVPNIYDYPVTLARPGNIVVENEKEIEEIIKLISDVSNERYPLACRLIDLCSSVILNGSSNYELYFLDGSVFKCSEESFTKDIEKLNFEVVNPEADLREIRLAALPVTNFSMEYDLAKDSYNILVGYLKSILKDENSLVMKANSRLELASANTEAIYIDEGNGYVYFNKTVVERALASTGRAIFDKNYARAILKSFHKFHGDFGIEESVVANKTIYRVKRSVVL